VFLYTKGLSNIDDLERYKTTCLLWFSFDLLSLVLVSMRLFNFSFTLAYITPENVNSKLFEPI